jgi:hypothetical protein
MLVLNPVDKFELEWCEGYSFLKIFSCEKNTSFPPSEPVLGMLGTFNTCFFLKYFLFSYVRYTGNKQPTIPYVETM